jgi:hypothetical protein
MALDGARRVPARHLDRRLACLKGKEAQSAQTQKAPYTAPLNDTPFDGGNEREPRFTVPTGEERKEATHENEKSRQI